MGNIPVWTLVVCVAHIRLSSCQSVDDISKIHDDVLKFNPMVRPVKSYSDQLVIEVSYKYMTTIDGYSDDVNDGDKDSLTAQNRSYSQTCVKRPTKGLAESGRLIKVAFHLMSINNFDTVQQKLTTNGYLEVEWINHFSYWDPTQYGNAYVISPKPGSVWRPKLTVMNSLKELKPIGEEYVYTLLYFNGWSSWYPAERFETACRVDVTYFPFDTQHCTWQMFIWGEGSFENQTDIQPKRLEVDLDAYVTNGEWELLSTRGWREVFGPQDGTGFPNLYYEITIRRRPSLLALTVLLPVVVLAGINVFVFTIPSESGERLSYAITALLSFGVFMSFILESMPSSTETLSIMAVNMSCLLMLSAIYVLCCVLSLRLFHRDDLKHPVPKSLQTVIVWLEVIVCLDPPAKNKVGVIRVASVTDGVSDARDVKNEKRKILTRKWRHDAYTDPAEMTWRRVSRTLDKLFFRFFFLLVLVSNVTVWAIMVIDYLKHR